MKTNVGGAMATETTTPTKLRVSRSKTGTFDGYRLDVSDTDGPYALVGRRQDAVLFAHAADLRDALREAAALLKQVAVTEEERRPMYWRATALLVQIAQEQES